MKRVRTTNNSNTTARTKPREPLVDGVKVPFHDSCERSSLEGIIEIPRDSAGRRMWRTLVDGTIVKHSKQVMRNSGIRTRSELQKLDSGLDTALDRRGLLDKVGFEKKQSNWRSMDDAQIVAYTKQFIRKNGISSKGELKEINSKLYQVLRKRKLLSKIGLKNKRRDWESQSDDELVAQAEQLMKDKNITGVTALRREDPALCGALARRNLMDKLSFDGALVMWSTVSDAVLLHLARTFMDEHNIYTRHAFSNRNRKLYRVLYSRNLIGELPFEQKLKEWSKMTDAQFLAYANKVISVNQLSRKMDLRQFDRRTYSALYKRGLLNLLDFKTDERAWSKYGNDELVKYAKKYLNDNNLRSRWALGKKDRGLYSALHKRKLLDRVFAETEAQRKASEDRKAAEEMLIAAQGLDAA